MYPSYQSFYARELVSISRRRSLDSVRSGAVTNQVFEGFQLESKFVHLENNGNIFGLLVDENFWSEESNRSYLQSGRLMGVLKIDAGPSHWEVHPDGDELLYLLSGSMDVV